MEKSKTNITHLITPSKMQVEVCDQLSKRVIINRLFCNAAANGNINVCQRIMQFKPDPCDIKKAEILLNTRYIFNNAHANRQFKLCNLLMRFKPGSYIHKEYAFQAAAEMGIL